MLRKLKSSDTLYAKFMHTLGNKGIVPDSDQTSALVELSKYLCFKPGMFKKVAFNGVYIWGPPGRGKSMLMDTCFINFHGKKVRIHFHEFMNEVNKKLWNSGTSLPMVIKEWFKGFELICFDEFYVNDIGNSALITEFLKCIKTKKCIFTSNFKPDDLFDDPVYHRNFIPAINYIKSAYNIISLTSFGDYRESAQTKNSCFYSLNQHNALMSIFNDGKNIKKITLSGRKFTTLFRTETALGINFSALCGSDSSYVDYLEISSVFSTVYLANITKADLESQNAVTRFIWLLDILYDKKITLYITSETDLIDMISACTFVKNYDRCVSRLNEMRYKAHILK